MGYRIGVLNRVVKSTYNGIQSHIFLHLSISKKYQLKTSFSAQQTAAHKVVNKNHEASPF